MPGDPQECRAHAKRCWALAQQTNDPVLKDCLVDTAQRWSRLAADLDATYEYVDKWGQPHKKAG
jgi:hypothetical protein